MAVLFKDKSDLTDTVDTTPEAIRGTGRVFHVGFQWTEQPLTIVTVYAPSLASERTDFFETQLLPAMPQHGGALVEGFDIWP